MEVIMALLAILSSLLIAILAHWAISRYRKLRLFKELGIPGPEPSFLTGNLFHLGDELTRNDVITNWLKKYGDVFGYYVGDAPVIVIKDLEMLKQIFVRDFHVFTNRPKPPLAMCSHHRSLIHLEGKRWKKVRSILSPAFTSGKIKLMTEIVNKKVDITVSVVAEKAKSNEMFDIYPVVQGLTLDVIADCAFAMKTQCQKNENDVFLLAVKEYLSFKSNPVVLFAIMFPFLAPFLVYVNRFLTTAGQTMLFINEHLINAIEQRKKNKETNSCNDLLQLVLDSNEKEPMGMADADIADNALTFLLAGYDTTSTALAFTFYLLSTHQDVQDKLYQEIVETEDSSYNTIQKLHYLDQVFNESLRCYTPVTGFISRSCSEDHQVNSILIPKGAQVCAPVWDIHHDPDLWPDPYKFDPDRWSPENKASINSMAFLPFGEGPRNCIGSRFALLEAKLALFRLVKEFKFVTCEKTDHPITVKSPSFITVPAKGVYLKAIPRSKAG